TPRSSICSRRTASSSNARSSWGAARCWSGSAPSNTTRFDGSARGLARQPPRSYLGVDVDRELTGLGPARDDSVRPAADRAIFDVDDLGAFAGIGERIDALAAMRTQVVEGARRAPPSLLRRPLHA